jgi:AcrR family transcriptional regulator
MCRPGAPVASRSHQEYVRWRARQIAYGRWEPWADAAVVRGHVRRLRAAGCSYEAIAAAAGVSPMTVHRALHGKQRTGDRGSAERLPSARVSAVAAQRLLAVTPAMVAQVAVRRDSVGTRRRLQALIAVGHPPVMVAHRLGVAPRVVTRLVHGTTATVNPGLHGAVCDLYERLWDVVPPGRTIAERKAAASARALAASHGWPAPMGLDDGRIDDPAYRPRARWRPAVGGDDSRHRCQGQSSTGAALAGKLSTDAGCRASARGSQCQAASARHRPGGHS